MICTLLRLAVSLPLAFVAISLHAAPDAPTAPATAGPARVTATPTTAQTGTGFTARLSAEELAGAGLDQLDAAQRARLDALVAAERAAAVREHVENARRRPVATRDEDGNIRSRIAGPFAGWRGRATIFRLENGQVWRQAAGGAFTPPEGPLDRPAVTIRRDEQGRHFMVVDDFGATVRVVRFN
jgi:hypothetical protein